MTNLSFGIIMRFTNALVGNAMNPKYDIGQKVIVRPVTERGASPREHNIVSYAGQTGEVANYYWISPRTGKIFFIYTVRLGRDQKPVVLYEDELEPCLS